MPTSPHIPIVPGTLCWLRSKITENAGIVVEAVSYYGLYRGLRVWICKSKSSVITQNTETLLHTRQRPGSEFHSYEHGLVPIAGPGLVNHVEDFDLKSQPETIGQLLRDAGLATKPVSTRSTPNVRR